MGLAKNPEREHITRHFEWGHGVAVRTQVSLQGTGIAVVSTTAPIAWRKLAYAMARLARADGGYDFVSWEHPDGRGSPDEHNTQALLYHHAGRVRGYLVINDGPSRARLNLASDIKHVDSNQTDRTTIGLLFVAFHWRRQGIGRALVQGAADHAGLPAHELIWQTPLTPAGRRLASAFAGPDGSVPIW